MQLLKVSASSPAFFISGVTWLVGRYAHKNYKNITEGRGRLTGAIQISK